MHAGFTGEVRNAKCSNEQDKLAILKEIEGSEAAVNASIDLLLHAGMSTADLRKIAECGVNIDSAGHFRWSLSMLGLLWWVEVGLTRTFSVSPIIGSIVLIEACLFICLLAWLPKDRKAFAANVVFKSFFCLFVWNSCVSLYTDERLKIDISSRHVIERPVWETEGQFFVGSLSCSSLQLAQDGLPQFPCLAHAWCVASWQTVAAPIFSFAVVAYRGCVEAAW